MNSLFITISFQLFLVGQPAPTSNFGGITTCSPGPGQIRAYVEKIQGKKLVDGAMKGRQRHGRWIEFWPTGKKKEQVFYCNGLLHRKANYWYENGMPALEGVFELGKPFGRWRFWEKTGASQPFTPTPADNPGDFFQNEGNRALKLHQEQRAIFLLDQAFRLSSDTPQIHRSLGVAHARLRNGPKAVFHYAQYLKRNPNAADATQIANVIASYKIKMRHAGSGGGQQTAPPMPPSAGSQTASGAPTPLAPLGTPVPPAAAPAPASDESPAPTAQELFDAGMQSYKLKDYTEAAQKFARSYQTDEAMDVALYRKALALRKSKAYDSAILAYEAYVKVKPNDPDGMYGLAETLRLSGNIVMARQYFQIYVQLEKRPSEAKYVDRAKQFIQETEIPQ